MFIFSTDIVRLLSFLINLSRPGGAAVCEEEEIVVIDAAVAVFERDFDG